MKSLLVAGLLIDSAGWLPADADPRRNLSADLPLEAGEKLHDPPIDIWWTPPKQPAMTITAVDVDGGKHVRLVVWRKGEKRHVVLETKAACAAGEHGDEMWMGEKNQPVFRCEVELGGKQVADEWIIRWTEKHDYPTIYRHWRGARTARDPKWAGARAFYGKQPPPSKPRERCCCLFTDWDPDNTTPDWNDKDYCAGSDDHHGTCVDAKKCGPDSDE